METPDDLVSIYRAANSTEAFLLKNHLNDEGIDAEVTEPNEPFAGLGVVPPDILVRRRDVPAAVAIIQADEQRRLANAAVEEDE